MFLECHDIDVNFPYLNGTTPLHFAVFSNACWAVKLILEDPRTLPNEQEGSGLFPLSIAVLTQNLELLDIFMKVERTDIDFDCQSPDWGTPLQIATHLQREHSSLWLLQVPGIDFNNASYY